MPLLSVVWKNMTKKRIEREEYIKKRDKTIKKTFNFLPETNGAKEFAYKLALQFIIWEKVYESQQM